MNRIMVLGIGPGGEDYILPVIRKKAAEADVLVGGRRAVDPFAHLGKELIPVTADLQGLALKLGELAKTKKVAVLVSGDPGFHSLLAYLRRHFSATELEVLPGVSSVQVAFARLGVPWQGAMLLSAHGREGNDLLPSLMVAGKKAILTDGKWTPGRLAKLVLENGGEDAPVALCRRLTTPAEEVVITRLSRLDGSEEGDCVMVILDE
ncbi:precorrin-6y C5,15-methyltransferase (decarboxylating) subunit CbiE [Dethiobacter alkaliphilus]|uniref:Precorrin-6y C5,15-methyltransferase (Decarboxylating), CbiE subunit n=1 Tax=Dethiobacter alkaliphilus AHT 1 TaxID=555088 RepID=C0GDX2_DETAL|nr:precorrin-6y C5,15-methyltransferase (decarboxylating) subunit CbiE [Dethiobacter alkaliphilus]EEG78266.1 precorrin-6y C5,15-methyltransferase (decarboxylating), CbiE subunit [Dethiobacter alkaliphilus AHT 1]